MNQENIRIGTIGYCHKNWLGNFYPQFCPQADFLRYYSLKFQAVELEKDFTQPPDRQLVQKWIKTTPQEFAFSIRFPKTVTHEGTLKSRLAAAEKFIAHIRRLKDKLGPLLLQFPYSFRPQSREACLILKGILEAMPSDLRVALDLENKCWQCDDLFLWLKKHNVALCLVDHPWVPRLNIQTADFLYLRFVGDTKAVRGDFTHVCVDRDQEMQQWSQLIQELISSRLEVFGFFGNHYSGHAPSTARKMQSLVGGRP